MQVGQLFVRLSLDMQSYMSGLKRARAGLQEVQRETHSLAESIKFAFKSTLIFGAAIGTVTDLTNSIRNAVTAGIDFNARMEQSETAFRVLLGSASEAKKMIDNLWQFAKDTPFEFQGIQESAQMLMAFGFQAQDVMPILKAVGEVAATAGDQANERMQRIIIALGQMRAKGKVQAEEMLQLTEANIRAWDYLAAEMGKSKQEVMKLVSEGLVPADLAIQAIVKRMEQDFRGMMQAQSQEYYGMIAKLRDNLNELYGQVMRPIFDYLKDEALPQLIQLTEQFTEVAKDQGLREAFKIIIPPAVVESIYALGKAVKYVFDLIRNNAEIIKTLVVGIGTSFLVLKTVTGVLSAFITVKKAFTGQIAQASGVMATISRLVGSYRLQVALAAAELGKMPGLLTKVKAAFSALSIGILGMNPVLFAVIATIGAVVAAAYFLYKAWVNNWGGIQEKTRAVFAAIGAYGSKTVNFLAQVFNQFKLKVFQLLQGILNAVAPAVGLIGKIAPGFEAGFERLRAAVNTKVGDIQIRLGELKLESAKISKEIEAANARVAKAFSSWSGSAQKAANSTKQASNSVKNLNVDVQNWTLSGTKAGQSLKDVGDKAEKAGKKGKKAAEDTRTAWEKAIDTLTAKMQVLQAQYEIAMAAMGENADQSKRLTAQLNFLTKQYELQKQIVELARQQYEAMRRTKGETAKETAEAASKYAQEAKQLADLSKQISETRLELQRKAWVTEQAKAKMELLNAQHDLAVSKLGNHAKKTEELRTNLEFLTKKIAAQEQVVKSIKQEYDAIAKAKGQNSKEALEAAAKYAQEAKALNDLKNQLAETRLELEKHSWETQNAKYNLEILNAEHELAKARLDENVGKIAELTVDLQFLSKELAAQQVYVQKLRNEYEAIAKAKGKDAEETRNAYKELLEAEVREAELSKKIRETNQAIREQQQEMQKLADRVTEVARRYRDDLAKAAEDYQQKVEEVYRKLAEDEKKLTEQYQNEVDRRAKSLRDFVGLFDAVTRKEVSGQQLLENLRGQLDVFREWQANLRVLAARGVDEGLLAELREMGPKAASEIAALTTLSDAELNEYVALWREKNALARQQAEQELSYLAVETQQKIAELRANAAAQLEQYRQEWEKKNKEIRENTINELKKLVEDAAKMGTEMITKMAAAISAAMPELTSALAGLPGFTAPSQGQGTQGDQVTQAQKQKEGVVNAAIQQQQGVISATTQTITTILEAWNEGSNLLITRHEELKNKLILTWQTIQQQLSGIGLKILADAKKTWNDFRNHIFDVIKQVEIRFTWLVNAANTWGINLMYNFIEGIRSQFDYLRQTLEAMTMMVDSYMPHSPAKVGPLSRLDEWGPALVQTFADGIRRSLPTLEDVTARMAALSPAALQTAVAGTSAQSSYTDNSTVNLNITIQGTNAKQIWAELEPLLDRELNKRGIRR